MLKENFQKGYGYGIVLRLNPYFNGTCSKSGKERNESHHSMACVLILILMEHAQRVQKIRLSSSSSRLNPYFNGTCSKRTLSSSSFQRTNSCLNPYFNGTCSKSTINEVTNTFVLS